MVLVIEAAITTVVAIVVEGAVIATVVPVVSVLAYLFVFLFIFALGSNFERITAQILIATPGFIEVTP